MSAKKEIQNQSDEQGSSSGAETVVGFAVLGLLVAGTVGILKALSMQSGFDVLLCLLGSTVAFFAVYYIYFGKH